MVNFQLHQIIFIICQNSNQSALEFRDSVGKQHTHIRCIQLTSKLILPQNTEITFNSKSKKKTVWIVKIALNGFKKISMNTNFFFEDTKLWIIRINKALGNIVRKKNNYKIEYLTFKIVDVRKISSLLEIRLKKNFLTTVPQFVQTSKVNNKLQRQWIFMRKKNSITLELYRNQSWYICKMQDTRNVRHLMIIRLCWNI